jgi:hypothetical protein
MISRKKQLNACLILIGNLQNIFILNQHRQKKYDAMWDI